MSAPNASYSITMRVQLHSDAGSIGRITTAVEEAAGTVIAVDVVESHHDRMVVDLTCNAAGEQHAQQITEAVDRLDGVTTHKVSDRKLSFLHSTVLSPDEAVLGKRAASGSRASGLRAAANARRAPAPGLTAT